MADKRALTLSQLLALYLAWLTEIREQRTEEAETIYFRGSFDAVTRLRTYLEETYFPVHLIRREGSEPEYPTDDGRGL